NQAPILDLNGSNNQVAGFALSGILEDDWSGFSVSNAGDINGDGIDDVIIGAYKADLNGTDSGQSYVVFGSSSSFPSNLNLSTLNGSNGFTINGIAGGDNSGVSVSSAGDINGDGIDDLIIGAFSADPNGDNSGQSYVVFGRNNGFSSSINLSQLNGSNGFIINGIDEFDNSGFSVSNAGDINGDGIDDLIIGARYGGYSGRSYVVFGKNTGFSSNLNLSTLNGSNGFTINGIVAGDQSGRSVSNAGDINGDRIDDLIIGAAFADPNGTDSGQSYVVFGKSNGFSSSFNLSTLNGSNGFIINGIAAGDESGRSVSSAGDINGDGIDDLIIGAPFADPNSTSSGQSYVVFGKNTGFSSSLNLSTLDGSNGFTLNGVAQNNHSGRSVSSAGDINGDGIDDLIIGALDASPNGISSGQSYVVFGSRSTFNSNIELSSLDGVNGFKINGINGSDYSGVSVSSAGDINGDGIDDLIIGAFGADLNNSDSGQSYVVFGHAGIGSSGVVELSQLVGSTTDGIDFSTTFTGTPVLIVDTDLTLVDANSANLVGATITITNLQDGVNEVLAATVTGNITSIYSNGVLTLSGTGTVAEYQQVLRTVTYNNTATTPDITVRIIKFVVDDGGSNFNTSTVATTNVVINQAPTDITLSNNSVTENVAANTVIGSFTTTDPDVGDTHSYSLVAGAGDTDNSVFTITNNQLSINSSPDFETKSSYSIRVETNDGNGGTYQETLAINVLDIGVLSINDVSVTEGNTGTTNATFTVSLTDPFAGTVTVNYATANGTAFSTPYDYTATSGQLSFSGGETTKTIDVAVLGDIYDEIDETFSVVLSNPTNATITKATGVGTIVDDDNSVSIGETSILEGNSGQQNLTFLVQLSAPSSQVVIVNYATADSTAIAGLDYIATSGTLSFSPGNTGMTVNVPIIGDTLDEPSESFFLNLTNLSNNTTTQAIGTIFNDDAGEPITLNGTSGNDRMNGGVTGEIMNGLAGNDIINGLAGNDTLNGGPGADVLTGGLGADKFLFESFSDSLLGNLDRIRDFNPGLGDGVPPTGGDRIKVGNPAFSPTSVFNVGILTAATLTAATEAAYAAADSNTGLVANEAGNQCSRCWCVEYQ
ncbi:Calx-beta domain-containing protein, partial [Cronbergia sp. UHCC 0137]|uniref:beta strand repeat-containing protein n=1 Tax=Cronbergia sp. UHCC 0137 TaxID=3110239 RepID=UPI002B216CC3